MESKRIPSVSNKCLRKTVSGSIDPHALIRELSRYNRTLAASETDRNQKHGLRLAGFRKGCGIRLLLTSAELPLPWVFSKLRRSLLQTHPLRKVSFQVPGKVVTTIRGRIKPSSVSLSPLELTRHPRSPQSQKAILACISFSPLP